MYPYQPVSYVPVSMMAARRPRMAQTAPILSPTLSPTVVRTALAGGLAIEAGLGAAGAWVGLYTGTHASGLLKFLGYGVGAMSAISGFVSLAELVMYVAKGLPVPPAAPAQQRTMEV